MCMEVKLGLLLDDSIEHGIEPFALGDETFIELPSVVFHLLEEGSEVVGSQWWVLGCFVNRVHCALTSGFRASLRDVRMPESPTLVRVQGSVLGLSLGVLSFDLSVSIGADLFDETVGSGFFTIGGEE